MPNANVVCWSSCELRVQIVAEGRNVWCDVLVETLGGLTRVYCQHAGQCYHLMFD